MEIKEFNANKNAVLLSLLDLLVYKNEKYGNSALEPINVFYKGNSINSIAIRLDDKLNRLINSSEVRLNDIADVAGYLVLYIISTDSNINEETFSDKVKHVLRSVGSGVSPEGDESTLMVFHKVRVDRYLSKANNIINKIGRNADEPELSIVCELLTTILSYMAENGMTDLSQFKD